MAVRIPSWAAQEEAPFWEGIARAELRVQGCTRCGRLRFPPRPFCPQCNWPDAVWRPMSGRASLWSFVIAHPPLMPPFAEIAPYNVIVAALDEDPRIRMVGNLLAAPGGAINEVKPDQIRIGARLMVVFSAGPGELTLPRWMYE